MASGGVQKPKKKKKKKPPKFSGNNKPQCISLQYFLAALVP